MDVSHGHGRFHHAAPLGHAVDFADVDVHAAQQGRLSDQAGGQQGALSADSDDNEFLWPPCSTSLLDRPDGVFGQTWLQTAQPTQSRD